MSTSIPESPGTDAGAGMAHSSPVLPVISHRVRWMGLGSLVTILALGIAAFGYFSCRRPRDPRAGWTPAEGREYLMVARRFALGGVGDAGLTSTGEFAFRAVLRSPSAPQEFAEILSPYSQATDEGKLYALCGIRATDRTAFEQYAARMTTTNPEVTYQSGCIVWSKPTAELVKKIGDGAYDSNFTKD